MEKSLLAAVSPSVPPTDENSLRAAWPNGWIAAAVAVLLIPSALAADPQGPLRRYEEFQGRRDHSPRPPSYLLREDPAIEQDPAWPINLPLLLPPNRPLSENRADTAEVSPSRHVYLENNDVVRLRLASGQASSGREPGHRLVFTVEEDVLADGITCIPRGTEVQAVVGPWTQKADGVLGAGRLEIQFEDVLIGEDLRVPLQSVRVEGRTLEEAMSWVSSYCCVSEQDAFIVGSAALADVIRRLIGRAVFKTDEVKFGRRDVIRVRVWSSWLLPCDAEGR